MPSTIPFLLCVLIISQILDILNIFDYIDISYYIDLNFILLILKFVLNFTVLNLDFRFKFMASLLIFLCNTA